MKRKKEMQYKRLFEIMKNHPNKVWSLDKLLDAVNFLLPDHLMISSTKKLYLLISDQLQFKVFKYVGHNHLTFYIFRYGALVR